MAEEKIVKQQNSANEMKSSLTLKHKLGYGAGDAGGVATLVLIVNIYEPISYKRIRHTICNTICTVARLEYLGYGQ
ncbi:MAG: hypothetical protein V9E84_03120 [Trichococcus flocculiformis]